MTAAEPRKAHELVGTINAEEELLRALLNDFCCPVCGACSWQGAGFASEQIFCRGCDQSFPRMGRVFIARRAPAQRGIAQWLMRRASVAAIYERYWRPTVIYSLSGISYSAELEFLGRWLDFNDGARTVDLCCGTGWHLRQLRLPGLVVGVDSSLPMLTRAGRSALKARTRQVFVADDIMTSRWRRPFDAAVMFGAMHLMPDVADTIRYLHGLIKRDGMLIALAICDPKLAPTDLRRSSVGFHLLSPEGYARALCSGGYTVEELVCRGRVIMFAARAV